MPRRLTQQGRELVRRGREKQILKYKPKRYKGSDQDFLNAYRNGEYRLKISGSGRVERLVKTSSGGAGSNQG